MADGRIDSRREAHRSGPARAAQRAAGYQVVPVANSRHFRTGDTAMVDSFVAADSPPGFPNPEVAVVQPPDRKIGGVAVAGGSAGPIRLEVLYPRGSGRCGPSFVGPAVEISAAVAVRL